MSGLTLAKTELPPDWISGAVGEPFLIRENLFNQFDISSMMPRVYPFDFEYSPPAGYGPLVRFLEDKYQAPICIHNGAKQAIGSLLYALKKSGHPNIFLRRPWWSLFPPLIEMHGTKHAEDPYGLNSAQLLVSPGNPDGYLYSDNEWNENQENCKELGIPVIHDAAYFNHLYLPPEISLKALGDVQVFTLSKLLGLSQLRLGFSVFHDTKLYDDVLAYQEAMSVGVSVLSQMFALEVLEELKNHPKKVLVFEESVRSDLKRNRDEVAKITSTILDPVPSNQHGMFLWAKCHDLKAFEESKIVVAEGTGFGMKGFVRMNLGLRFEQVKKIVERLNNWGI